MSYLQSLPKELLNIIDLYLNVHFWIVLNQLLRLKYIQSWTSVDLPNVLKDRYASCLDELNVKYMEKLTCPGMILYEIYYQIPESQVITCDILLKYINGTFNRYNNNELVIAKANKTLKDIGCKKQIVLHSLVTHMNPFSYDTKYIIVDID